MMTLYRVSPIILNENTPRARCSARGFVTRSGRSVVQASQRRVCGGRSNDQTNMKKSSFASSEKKVYRFNGVYRWYHFVAGSAFLTTAVLVAVLVHDFLIFSIGLALFSLFMIFARSSRR